MTQVTLEQAMHVAMDHHLAGRLAEAEAVYRQILAAQPNHAEAMVQLSIIAIQVGRFESGIDLARRAIAAAPGNPVYHFHLGATLQIQGHVDDAIACYERALVLNPDYSDALNNLGNAWMSKGKVDQAIAGYQQALAQNPRFVDAHNNLGIALNAADEPEQAIASFQRALALNGGFVKAHVNLGIVLNERGRHDQAIACFSRALELDPKSVEAHVNLGIAFKDKEQLDQAVACLQRALAIKPDLAEIHHDQGNAHRAAGQLDLAIASFKRALALKPGFVAAHDDLILTMLHHPDSDSQRISLECRNWNRQHAEPRKSLVPSSYANDRDPHRPLCVGYVSGDFMQHPCALFLLPLFRNHDHRQFEIICYSEVARPDHYTHQMRQLVPNWRDTVRRSDAEVADMIRHDRIDILVDLKLHTPFNRLLVFAQKPAPVQATWLGYPGTTGLDTVDYRLTDPYLDPAGTDETVYSERSVRLPDTFWCYDSLAAEPHVNSPPFAENGFITFGSLNSFCKISDVVLSLWAKVLSIVRQSRLILLAPDGTSRERVLNRLGEGGIRPERVEFLKRQLRADYLKTFDRIDIALDTFPYNGHTTSLDALWMGVPVVTLVGQTIVGRAGLTQLTNLGLPDLIAQNSGQYIQIASDLAADRSRLGQLRSTLRQRMQDSPLMDGDRFARNIEAAYRTMWQTWCRT